MTFTARWEPQDCTITWDGNGGKWSDGESKKETRTKVGTVLSAVPSNFLNNEPTSEDFEFVGWFTQKKYGAQVYDYTTVEKEDTTYYAHWKKKIKCVVTLVEYDKNEEKITATYGYAMPEITPPTRPGYEFRGYYTGTNGKGTQYYNVDCSSTRNWDKTSATTLYAHWVIGTYAVTLNPDNGSINAGNVTSYTYGVGATLPTNVTRLGYDFKGWYSSPYSSGERATAIGTSEYGNKTYYARWRRRCIAVTFDASGGTLSDNDNLRVVGQGLKYGQSVNFYGNHKDDFARFTGGVKLSATGITHDLDCNASYPGGWLLASDLLDSAVGSPVTYVLYVTKLESAPENLKFMIGAGNGGGETSAILSARAADISTTGKYVIHTTVKNASSALTEAATGMKTFDRAFWWTSPGNAAVGMKAWYAFSVYGGYLQDSSVTNRNEPDGFVSTSLPVPTKSGYRFSGWYTTSGSQGTKVDDETVVSATSNQTLYAHWTGNTYTVVFDQKGGTGGSASVAATYGSTMP